MAEIVVAFINNLGAILLGMAAVLSAWTALQSIYSNGRKLDENTSITKQGVENAAVAANSAKEAGMLINGRLDDIIKQARNAAYAQGFADGQQKKNSAQ